MGTDDDQPMSSPEVAALIGIKLDTWRAYVTRGKAPEPDGWIADRRWWWKSTITTWLKHRPGRGYWGHTPTQTHDGKQLSQSVLAARKERAQKRGTV